MSAKTWRQNYLRENWPRPSRTSPSQLYTYGPCWGLWVQVWGLVNKQPSTVVLGHTYKLVIDKHAARDPHLRSGSPSPRPYLCLQMLWANLQALLLSPYVGQPRKRRHFCLRMLALGTTIASAMKESTKGTAKELMFLAASGIGPYAALMTHLSPRVAVTASCSWLQTRC